MIKILKFKLVLFFVLSIVSWTFSQDQMMAVIDVQLQGDAKKYLSNEEKQFLSTAIRSEASQILGGSIEILSQAKFKKLVKANAEGCSEAGCFAGFVAEIGVDLGVQPTISYAFGKLKMTLEVADSKATISSRTLSVLPTEEGKNQLGEQAILAAKELFQEVAARLKMGVSTKGTWQNPSEKSVTSVKSNAVAQEGEITINEGCFVRGQETGPADELPTQKVCVDAFKLDATEVTQGQYKAVMNNNPSRFTSCGDNCPVESVSWFEANDYCTKIGKRLPTEAEWEYAARAGSSTKWICGNSADCLFKTAWFNKNADEKTHPVAQKEANAWGLFDMAGNVREWTADWYDAQLHQHAGRTNPKGPNSGPGRVLRGGGWYNDANAMRSGYRYYDVPKTKRSFVGFRCAASIK